MLKKSLLVMAIGSLVTGSAFAMPSHIQKMLMKDQMKPSEIIKDNNRSQYKFSGTWAGTCTFGGETEEVKFRILEDNETFKIMDLTDDGWYETAKFDAIQHKTNTSKDFYDSFTSRLTRINENNLKFEGTGLFASISNIDKRMLSAAFTSMFVLDNNQLTFDTTMTTENGKKVVEKCSLKRTG